MKRGMSREEAKRIVHEMEYAKAHDYYAAQNRKAEAKAQAEAYYKAEAKYRREQEERERRKNSEPVSFSALLGTSLIGSLLFAVANEFIHLNDANFFANLGVSCILIFLVCLFG